MANKISPQSGSFLSGQPGADEKLSDPLLLQYKLYWFFSDKPFPHVDKSMLFQVFRVAGQITFIHRDQFLELMVIQVRIDHQYTHDAQVHPTVKHLVQILNRFFQVRIFWLN